MASEYSSWVMPYVAPRLHLKANRSASASRVGIRITPRLGTRSR